MSERRSRRRAATRVLAQSKTNSEVASEQRPPESSMSLLNKAASAPLAELKTAARVQRSAASCQPILASAGTLLFCEREPTLNAHWKRTWESGSLANWRTEEARIGVSASRAS